ncbi:hypothetical protein JL09_g6609 [Pichia kudriavzevii]|uniref:Uncharacterized protein n=1 Tax=Pichia kudriavzevii TaxID=4909 RepID=A0A099NP45_PICKU|nr:hypothetical protein JL09_g6609 [Pichia kudriavzevii]
MLREEVSHSYIDINSSKVLNEEVQQ